MAPPVQPPRPLWEQPIFWGVAGLLLMVGGWNLASWRPPLGRRTAEAQSQIRDIRSMSDDEELNRRLDGLARLAPVPPYQLLGRLVTVAGIVLFGFAAVRMYHSPSGPPRDEMPEPDPERGLASAERSDS